MKLEQKVLEQLVELIEEAPEFAPAIVSQAKNFGSMTDTNFDHNEFTVWNTRCLNLLSRINSELGGDFDISRFSHQPEYTVENGFILRSS